MGINDRDYMRRDYRKGGRSNRRRYQKNGSDSSPGEKSTSEGSPPHRLLSGSATWIVGAITLILAMALVVGIAKNQAKASDRDLHSPATKATGGIQFPLDLNTATLEELDALPNIGPVRATRIINSRPFNTIDALLEIKGIGPNTLEEFRKYLIIPSTPQIQLAPTPNLDS